MVVYRGYKFPSGCSLVFKGAVPCLGRTGQGKPVWGLPDYPRGRAARLGPYNTGLVLLVDIGIDHGTAACMIGQWTEEYWHGQFRDAWRVTDSELWEWAHLIGVDL